MKTLDMSTEVFNTHSPEWELRKLKEMDEDDEIDNQIVEATEMVNIAYEKLLHELFKLGDYMFDLRIEYQDIDGKTISMSWQDRDKRIGWLAP